MIELRWVVPEGTFVPGNGYPKLQYRQKEERLFEEMHEFRTLHIMRSIWSEWIDVPTVKGE